MINLGLQRVEYAGDIVQAMLYGVIFIGKRLECHALKLKCHGTVNCHIGEGRYPYSCH